MFQRIKEAIDPMMSDDGDALARMLLRDVLYELNRPIPETVEGLAGRYLLIRGLYGVINEFRPGYLARLASQPPEVPGASPPGSAGEGRP